MQEINTQIKINAPKEKVWQILMDFAQYPEWNPFVQAINGKQQIDEQLEVYLGLGDKPMKFTPTVKEYDHGNKFAWLGKLFLPYLFDGRHCFELVEEDDGVLFIHQESFRGILVWPIMKMIRKNTIDGFEQMNNALKERAESA